MATVTNPTRWSLFSHALMREIPAKTMITGVDDELAKKACSSGIFILDYAEEEKTAAPVRRSVQRGSKKVEVTDAPEVEKR
jgi:hypothetical protein